MKNFEQNLRLDERRKVHSDIMSMRGEGASDSEIVDYLVNSFVGLEEVTSYVEGKEPPSILVTDMTLDNKENLNNYRVIVAGDMTHANAIQLFGEELVREVYECNGTKEGAMGYVSDIWNYYEKRGKE